MRYEVVVTRWQTAWLEIEADSPEEAKAEALEIAPLEASEFDSQTTGEYEVNEVRRLAESEAS